MKPWTTLARTHTPDGTELTLTQRDDEFAIRAGGKPLMSSREHGSEEVMSIIAARRAGGSRATWLVGGLGLGYTLRTALDRLPSDSKVVVAELLPAVVEWNRGPLSHLANAPLEDARVEVYVGDVRRAMAERQGTFDAILLDVDNGPSALTDEGNHPLYGPRGLRTIRGSLRPGGTLIVWSATHDARFVRRLENEGFRVEVEEVGSRGGAAGRRHVLFVATT